MRLMKEQKRKLVELLNILEDAEEQSNKDFRIAYRILGDWCIATFGEQFWEDTTISELSRMCD